MPKYIMFNTVNSDGVGDFSHLADIIKKLRADPKFNDVEFLPIVHFHDGGSDANYVRIAQQLEDMNIPFLYGKKKDHEQYILDPAVQKQLNDADQALIISYDSISAKYMPYLKPGIPIKSIMEHDSCNVTVVMNGGFDDSLGLERSGVKIDNIPQIKPDDAWDIMMKHDPAFASQLLANTTSPDFATLHAQNIFVPAYFNKYEDFNSFVHFIGANPSVSQEKNIVMSVSGKGCEIDDETLMPLLKTSSIKRIELFTPDNETPEILDANPAGTK